MPGRENGEPAFTSGILLNASFAPAFRGEGQRASLTSTVSMLPLAVAGNNPLPGWCIWGVAYPQPFKEDIVSALEEPSVRCRGQKRQASSCCLRAGREQERVPERPCVCQGAAIEQVGNWLWGTSEPGALRVTGRAGESTWLVGASGCRPQVLCKWGRQFLSHTSSVGV